MDNYQLSRLLMEMLQKTARGRDNAIPREEILRYLRLFKHDLDDRACRKIYTSLPVCSCEKGLFLPETSDEVMEFKTYLTKQCGPFVADKRTKIVFAFRPELAPAHGEQMALFGGRL